MSPPPVIVDVTVTGGGTDGCSTTQVQTDSGSARPSRSPRGPFPAAIPTTRSSAACAGAVPAGWAVPPTGPRSRRRRIRRTTTCAATTRHVADGLSEIVIGAVGTDAQADGKAPFLDAIDRALALQEGGVRVSAPARDLDPVNLVRRSGLPLELLGLTFS
ncbi:hypothetical protein [Aureimonas leprariae]|uniref:Uncharacterized protein n=1 Tax=Plantimonas leprariae TaxID=2615207 RepID=A0A7V7TXW3_9HYPH|nr:hypothetical protein [Aureimonas leprariae]KAB0676273.1 hypothetical protein F6X38_21440 [Aureimonas leprariae]